MNPLFGMHEYIPDGEPHIFNNRLYLYGSQDVYRGTCYSPGDYSVWSCPLDDLSDWRHDGVIYRKTQDPRNPDGKLSLYAPDVIQGYDGMYYLYYELETVDGISVARSASPSGPFAYYGEVTYPEGIDTADLPAYPYGFDPGLFRENGRVYIALGFSVDFPIKGMDLNPRNMKGAFIAELAEDMVTMKNVPVFVIPGYGQGKGTSFDGHEFLEASSLRRYGNTYYFIYSSQAQHELCYAAAENIFGPYTYGGVLISNAFEGNLRNNWANNHGSLVRIGDEWYIFYHRHTCGIQYSRQACAERITFRDGVFETARVTCQGTGKELPKGIYPAGMACYVHDGDCGVFIPFGGDPMNAAQIDGERIIRITDTTVTYRDFSRFAGIGLYFENAGAGTVELYVNRERQGESALSEYVEFICEGNGEITLVFRADSPVTMTKIAVL